MKSVVGLSFLILVLTVTFGNVLSSIIPVNKEVIFGWEVIGPIDNYTCPGDGVFPDENDCQQFISCWDGAAVLNICTEVQLFDLRYLGCNWAEYVDCGERYRDPTFPPTVTPPATEGTTTTVNSSIPTSPTTPPPEGNFTCPEDGAFAHEQKCEYYWICYAGTAQLKHCELDYLFDLTYMGCNFPHLTDCQDRERPEGASSTITPPSTSTARPTGPTVSTTGGTAFQCPKPNGTFPDPENCSGFYVCISNIPIHELCPDGLHFHPVKEMCDWPAAVGCEVN